MRHVLVFLLAAITVSAQDAATTRPAHRFDEKLLEPMEWRSIGPANMGGRVTDMAVVEAQPQHFYVAAATGGVWKTVNHGTTWTPIFDRYGSASIGDIDVCQSNPDLIWVGTGEANARNSVTHGDGVYRSTDGGKSFQNMGLRGTRHIGRVIIHPKRPETVYVAALGCVYQPSSERGLYRTTDGGASWSKILHIDDETGVIDLAMDPSDPDTLYAGTYSVRRDGFSGSDSPTTHTEKGGVFKTTDGGATWRKLAKGLPTGPVGRIGIDIFRKDPRIVVAIVETKRSTGADTTPSPGGPYMGVQLEEIEGGVQVSSVVEGGPAQKAGFQAGDLIREFDGQPVGDRGDLMTIVRARKAGDKVKVVVVREGKDVALELTLGRRPERGETSGRNISCEPAQDDPNKGGVYRSEDGGETWTHVNTVNPRPFYYSQIRIDPLDDQRIYVLGVNLHVSSDGGRKFNSSGARGIHVDHHAMWIDPRDSHHLLLGCDGGINTSWDRGATWEHLANLAIGQYYAIGLDTAEPYNVYGGLQDNGTWVVPSRTRNAAIGNDDCDMINGGDGFYARVDPSDPATVYCESQYGMVVRHDRRTRASHSIRPRERGLRWEWNTPIEISPHDPKRVYIAANQVFESVSRGDGMKPISGDLCRTAKGSVTVLGLSPLDENVIWAGTNDGAVHVTKDRGKTWTDVTASVPGLPEGVWITRVEPSRSAAGAAYLTAEGRRLDDLRTLIWRTTDFGATWTPLTEGLPADEPVYVLREHPRNPNLLFAGTERGVYASIDAGARWVSLRRNLPVVPVHDLAIQVSHRELVAGTHGRSIWILDISPLETMTPVALEDRMALFEPADSVVWSAGRNGWFGGAKAFRGQNPPAGTQIWYYLREDAKDASITILDAKGGQVARLTAPTRAGLHRVPWLMQRGRSRAGPGEYVVVLSADGASTAVDLKVRADPAAATE